MKWSAMKQILNWKDCDNLNIQYFYCLLKMANGITCYECPMTLTKQITITTANDFEELNIASKHCSLLFLYIS